MTILTHLFLQRLQHFRAQIPHELLKGAKQRISGVSVANQRASSTLSQDFHSTKRALWLDDSWSRAPDQIQMYPDRDTMPQLLPAPAVLLWLLKEKNITKHLISGPSGN